jgi:serine/threonine protein kinase/tetratricopeptide (TPR) repeat protein
VETGLQLERGTQLGPYVIQEHIASGGMGEVYRARDPRLGRDVAVKLLSSVGDASPEAVARFQLEARAAAALSHPNILTVFDVGTHAGKPFLVTELLEGRTLRERLQWGPLAPALVVRLGLQIARGIAAAHALRIVHRDLKPENLFLLHDETVKILDFGLAKLRGEALPGSESPTLDASAPARLMGTLAYMAPEQLRAEPVDERVDLFALGSVLHEMLTGRSAFRRRSGAETISALLRETPPPFDAGTVPPSLARLVLHCLEKDAGDRFQTATDLVFALETVQADLDNPAPAAASAVEPAEPPSIAVLPFADMSPARDQGHLCEGIAEELINALTHVDGLRVAARSSSFQFRGSAADIRAVGVRLGVTAVLEGSVRLAGGRLRVTVQLIDVKDGYHRWSQRFDRSSEDVFAIQDEIAERVATALRGVLSANEKQALRRPETAMEAYDYFLRGVQLLHRFERKGMEMARAMFERAIALDPGYAPAHAGLADAHSWFYEWWGGGQADADAADEASRRALALAPNLAEAHASRGFALSSQRRYAEAAEEFEEAIRLNPRSFDAYYYYARTCFAWGRIERSVELFRRASELRPEDYQSSILLGQSLFVLGREQEARESNREGIRRAERQLELNPVDVRALALGANALNLDGQQARALRWSEKAIGLKPDDQSVLINAACVRAQAGLKEEALRLLEDCFSRGWGKRDWIEHDPDYDSLRDDPRFQALLARLR